MSRRVEAIVELTRGPRVLNVGAAGNVLQAAPDAPGFLHGALVRAGFSTLAVDIDERGVEWLARHGFDALRVDAEDLGDGEPFDSIVAGEVLEHLVNPGRFLSGCLARLKPGGRLVLSTPQPFAPAHVLLHLLRPGSWNPEH